MDLSTFSPFGPHGLAVAALIVVAVALVSGGASAAYWLVVNPRRVTERITISKAASIIVPKVFGLMPDGGGGDPDLECQKSLDFRLGLIEAKLEEIVGDASERKSRQTRGGSFLMYVVDRVFWSVSGAAISLLMGWLATAWTSKLG